MSVPIRGYYDSNELHKYFDAYLRLLLSDEGIDTFNKSYTDLIPLINDTIALQTLYLIFGDFIKDRDIFFTNSSKLHQFIMGNYLNVKEFLNWYKTGHAPNVEYTESVKRFLTIGLLYIDIQTIDIVSYKSDILVNYKRYDNILFIDGDNLYVHITPLFRIISDKYYRLIFFKKDNISNIFASFYRNNKEHHEIIESYGFKKDAADVSLTTLCTYIRENYINYNKDEMKPDVKHFYIITGDEYAEELVNISNHDIIYTIGNLNADTFIRLNAQPILYRKNRYSWALDSNAIDPKIFGEILPAEYDDRIKINWTIIDAVFNGPINRPFRFKYDVMCTPWLIRLIKNTLSDMLDQEYSDIVKILLDNTVVDFDTLRSKIDTFNQVQQEKLYEKYLVIIGAKFFTKDELRKYFLSNHYKYLQSEVYPKMIHGTYQLNQFEMVSLINKFPLVQDALYYFYNFITPSDLFVNTLDIPLALGVTNMTFDEQGNISTITIKKI